MEAIGKRAQLVAPALLLAYRTLLDELWSLPRPAVFLSVAAHRRRLNPPKEGAWENELVLPE